MKTDNETNFLGIVRDVIIWIICSMFHVLVFAFHIKLFGGYATNTSLHPYNKQCYFAAFTIHAMFSFRTSSLYSIS